VATSAVYLLPPAMKKKFGSAPTSSSFVAIATAFSAAAGNGSRVEHRNMSGGQPFGPRSFNQSSPAASWRARSATSQGIDPADGRSARMRSTAERLPHTTSVQKLSCAISGYADSNRMAVASARACDGRVRT
jgi:hypothetical protein